LQVELTGLWLHPSGLLGASPDGFVGSDCIIEIKCPYAHRKTKDLKKSLSQKPVRKSEEYIVCWSEKHQEYNINEAHEYYHQIQGQLHITQRKLCYLVIWAPSDKENPLSNVEIIPIKISDGWASNLEKMLHFHEKWLLPHLMEKLK